MAEMTSWGEFILVFVLFFACHLVPARPAVRNWLIGRLGKGFYLAAYSIVSLALFGWLIVATARAPYVALWSFSPWQMWVPNIAMPFACILVAFGVAAPNPLSIASHLDESFDPEHPGIAGVARHPILMAVTIWALAHVVPNGDFAHVLMFGIFAVLGAAGMYAVDVRKRREHGTETWRQLSQRTSLLPFGAIFAGRWLPGWRDINLGRLTAAVVMYLALLMLHGPVIGVSPLPPL